jgi:uncharacterized membrane protein YkvA (DUF1232 family)
VLVSLAIGFVTVLVVGWILLAVAIARARPSGGIEGGTARLLPDVIRLLRNLARDPTLPRSVRWKLGIALIYNVQPVNLIPDFVPLLGVVDNLVITAWALRSALKAAGPDAVARHWTGTADGLAVLVRLVHLDPAPQRHRPTGPTLSRPQASWKRRSSA